MLHHLITSHSRMLVERNKVLVYILTIHWACIVRIVTINRDLSWRCGSRIAVCVLCLTSSSCFCMTRRSHWHSGRGCGRVANFLREASVQCISDGLRFDSEPRQRYCVHVHVVFDHSIIDYNMKKSIHSHLDFSSPIQTFHKVERTMHHVDLWCTLAHFSSALRVSPCLHSCSMQSSPPSLTMHFRRHFAGTMIFVLRRPRFLRLCQ